MNNIAPLIANTLERAKILSCKELSQVQKEAYFKPCPLCNAKLEHFGDLGDFDHDTISCSNPACDYVLFFDGSTMND